MMIIYVAFGIAITVACYVTKSGWPIWGFAFLPSCKITDDNGNTHKIE